jgi:signal transduction histidine kinase
MAESSAAERSPGQRSVGRPAWWQTRSLRARLTVLATSVLAIGLGAGALLLVVSLGHSLTTALDASARRTAQDVAVLVNNGEALPEPLPVGDGNTVVVQVIDSAGRVDAASAGADHLVPLLPPPALAEIRAGKILQVSGDQAGVTGSLRVLGVAAGPRGDRRTVVVAVDASQTGESVRVLRTALFIGVPILLVLLALLSWYVVGRALRPVEELRRGAEEITGAGGARQLPVAASDDEVHRLALTLNDMLGRLDAASAQQRAFVADAAHELRSPLASLRTQLEVAHHLGDRADWPRTADGALVDVARLSRLIDDLLLLARMDGGGSAQQLRRTPVDVTALVADCATGYAGARVPVEMASTAPAISDADPDAMRRVVVNLLDNAVRHATSRVTVSVALTDDGVTITVADDGPGIPVADRDRVFDRFTRLDDARSRDAGGTGLGLAIVRELVQAHGGRIDLADAGPGLRAVVHLPPPVHRRRPLP